MFVETVFNFYLEHFHFESAHRLRKQAVAAQPQAQFTLALNGKICAYPYFIEKAVKTASYSAISIVIYGLGLPKKTVSDIGCDFFT